MSDVIKSLKVKTGLNDFNEEYPFGTDAIYVDLKAEEGNLQDKLDQIDETLEQINTTDEELENRVTAIENWGCWVPLEEAEP